MKYILIIAFVFACSSCVVAQPKYQTDAATSKSLQQKSDSLKLLFALFKTIAPVPKNDSLKNIYNTVGGINNSLTGLKITVTRIDTATIYFKGAYGTGTKTDPIRWEP